ncbi:threonine synthase [Xanthovirga aplysinae]|uniref:threonine synthase n=1 Tax=Xanthovirga aplysinae TaxID=2529853 RepID=UPI0012BC685A|nr:threonine synthase [Xanthovirga aplysinae]MTI29919.1 threonine synthase [Xanthovirga aplysinae]
MDSTKVFSSLAVDLSCSKCRKNYPINQLQYYSTCCNKPLIVNYPEKPDFKKEELVGRESSMWRYLEMLPVFEIKNIVSLGEGMTPILEMDRLAVKYGFSDLKMKDEGLNPTASFKARGISMAISKAKELGVTECVTPTAGNAGGAMSAYCAAAGMKATVLMPNFTPKIFQDECRFFGAEVILVDGMIDKCGEMSVQIQKETGAFNISTLKEPYRLEGKKTMGYEIAEQLNWELPDVILYPTGGGTGLIGIWKAFHEMMAMGWIPENTKLPRMVVVQSANCTPMVDMINGKEQNLNAYGESIANGLAVPKAFGEDLIHQVVKESKGMAVAVTEEQIMEGVKEICATEGICVAPEGAAVWMALRDLSQNGFISKEEKVLLLNTGSGYKTFEEYR